MKANPRTVYSSDAAEALKHLVAFREALNRLPSHPTAALRHGETCADLICAATYAITDAVCDGMPLTGRGALGALEALLLERARGALP